jgi:WXG100 family type VII secretion target
MAAAQSSITDYTTFLQAAGNYEDVGDIIKLIANNLASTAQGSVSGWQGSAQVAFQAFVTLLNDDIKTLNSNIQATVDALNNGQSVTANTDFENSSQFTNLGAANVSPVG